MMRLPHDISVFHWWAERRRDSNGSQGPEQQGLQGSICWNFTAVHESEPSFLSVYVSSCFRPFLNQLEVFSLPVSLPIFSQCQGH
jgi:hypothetical protein